MMYRLIATGNDDGSIRWWNPASGSTITLRHHKNTVSCMCMAKLKRNVYLISGGFDGAVGIWDITNRRSVNPRLEYMFKAHTGRVESDAIMGWVFSVDLYFLFLFCSPPSFFFPFSFLFSSGMWLWIRKFCAAATTDLVNLSRNVPF